MKTLLKVVGPSALMVLLTFALTLGTGAEAKAQAGPLTVFNTTPCTIWVQGQTGLGMTPGCTTPFLMVPPMGMVSIPPCSGPTYSWYHVHYGLCPMPGPGCPIGTTNSAVAICGMPTVMIPDCTGTMPFTPTWTGTTIVTF